MARSRKVVSWQIRISRLHSRPLFSILGYSSRHASRKAVLFAKRILTKLEKLVSYKYLLSHSRSVNETIPISHVSSELLYSFYPIM